MRLTFTVGGEPAGAVVSRDGRIAIEPDPGHVDLLENLAELTTAAYERELGEAGGDPDAVSADAFLRYMAARYDSRTNIGCELLADDGTPVSRDVDPGA